MSNDILRTEGKEQVVRVPDSILFGELSGHAKLLWIALWRHTGPSDDIGDSRCFPGRELLCRIVGIGKDCFARVKQELMAYGVLSQEQEIGPDGKFGPCIYVIRQRPKTVSRKPDTGSPDTGFTGHRFSRSPVNSTLSSTKGEVVRSTPPPTPPTQEGGGGGGGDVNPKQLTQLSHVSPAPQAPVVSLPPTSEPAQPVREMSLEREPSDPNYRNPVTRQPEIHPRTQYVGKARLIIVEMNRLNRELNPKQQGWSECSFGETIADRLLDVGGDFDGVIDMVNTVAREWKQIKDRNGQPMTVHFTPLTLFKDREKFLNYYGKRQSRSQQPASSSNGKKSIEDMLKAETDPTGRQFLQACLDIDKRQRKEWNLPETHT